MSSNSTNPFITLDSVSESASYASGHSTNPFLGQSVPLQASSPVGLPSVQNFDRVVRALSDFTLFGQNSNNVDHIEKFNGEGMDFTVASKLKIFIADFHEFFLGRNLEENNKIILLKKRLSGKARHLIDFHRPTTFTSAKILLEKSFSLIHLDQPKLLSMLTSIKFNKDDKVQEFALRLQECAEVMADQLELSLNSKSIFDPLSQTFLRAFEPYLAVHNDVSYANSQRNFPLLVDTVIELLNHNPNLLKNPPSTVSRVHENKNRENECSYCKWRGHNENTCWSKYPDLKPSRFRSNNNANNQNYRSNNDNENQNF